MGSRPEAGLNRRGLLGAGLAMLLGGTSARAQLGPEGLPPCREDEIVVTGPFGTARFAVTVARTPQEQARGLMFVRRMSDDTGMLFAYDSPRRVSFWMRNTLIPLDMLFIDAEGRVRHIHENAQPRDETPVPSRGPVVGVLEINGGLSSQVGIAPGAVVRHPALPQGEMLLRC
jgi:uncharacterized membrane protein (UPF0127 family)